MKGDMTAYASSKTGLDMETCHKVLTEGLSICTDWEFYERYMRDRNPNYHSYEYMQIVEFLQKMV